MYSFARLEMRKIPATFRNVAISDWHSVAIIPVRVALGAFSLTYSLKLLIIKFSYYGAP